MSKINSTQSIPELIGATLGAALAIYIKAFIAAIGVYHALYLMGVSQSLEHLIK